MRTWKCLSFLEAAFVEVHSHHSILWCFVRTWRENSWCRKVNIQFKCHLCSMDLKIKMPLILTTFFLNSKYIHSCVPDQRFVCNLIISITQINIQILDIVFFFFFLTKPNLYVEKVEIQFQCHFGPLTWKKDANSFYIIFRKL